jgi:hypothetical protein
MHASRSHGYRILNILCQVFVGDQEHKHEYYQLFQEYEGYAAASLTAQDKTAQDKTRQVNTT